MNNSDALSRMLKLSDDYHMKSYNDSKQINDAKNKPTFLSNVADDMIGGTLAANTLGSTLLGGALGSAVSDDYKHGAYYGALIGGNIGIIASLAGAAIARNKAKRTLEQQAEVDADPHRTLLRAIIPGYSRYDSVSRHKAIFDKSLENSEQFM